MDIIWEGALVGGMFFSGIVWFMASFENRFVRK